MAFIKASLQRSYAESFLTDLERNDNQYFLFVAKGTTWSNDNSPPAYSDTVSAEYDVMNNIIAYKKINPGNVVFALPRYEWSSGTSYDQYDDSVELFNEDNPKVFYVVTDENNIYKCLGNSGGAVSTVVPSGIGNSIPFTTADGYTWKYLSTLVESDVPYELTDYMPVDYAYSAQATETSNQYNAQAQAIDGEISAALVTNASGSSAGVYLNSVFRTSSTNTTTLIDVSGFTKVDDETKIVKITNSESLSRLRQTSPGFQFQNYVGYMLRVERSTKNQSEVGNYGVIVEATDSGTQGITFVVKNDAIDFVITPTTSSTQYASVEIVPFVRVVGDGYGAYCVPKMNNNKNIASVSVVDGGYGYSRAEAFVNSPKTAATEHPTIRPITSPKGGHGSNILRELNVKDVILIIDIGEEDSEKFIGSGSYRQFGIIKNPILSDGTARVAGSEFDAFRDVSLYVPAGVYSPSHFSGDRFNTIIGLETYTAAKVVSVKSLEQGADLISNKITLKTVNCGSPKAFITANDRINRYSIVLDRNNPGFLVGETVKQTIPAGTVFSGGAVYGFSVTSRARIVSVEKTDMTVELETNTSLVSNISGATLEGISSRASAQIVDIQKNYGEPVMIIRELSGKAQVVSTEDDSQTNTEYSVVDVGETYYEAGSVPSYSGLQKLTISSSANAATGGIDITSYQLTRSSFSNGDTVVQGSTSGVSNYARGTVYYWDFVNTAKGYLYVTNPVGRFRSVETHGLTGTTLGNYIVSSVTQAEIKPTSGEVLYIQNVRPIQRTLGQEEEFRIRLGF